MRPNEQQALSQTRRHFLRKSQAGLGAMTLGELLGDRSPVAAAETSVGAQNPLAPKQPPLPAKAKRVIYIELAGAPPQQEMFDYKPTLVKLNMQPCPDEMLKNQRFAFIKGHPKLLGTPYKFAQHGSGGTWVSELLPNIATIADVAILGSVWASLGNDAGGVADRNELQFGLNGVASATIGRGLTYYGGSGIDSVTFEENSSVAFLSAIYLGAGQDEVSIATGANLGGLKVNFGVDNDSEIFNNLSTYDFDIVLINYNP